MITATLVGGIPKHNSKFVKGLRSIGVKVVHSYPLGKKPTKVEGFPLVISGRHTAPQVADLDEKILIPWSISGAQKALEQRGILREHKGGRERTWSDEDIWEIYKRHDAGEKYSEIIRNTPKWRKRTEGSLRAAMRRHVDRVVAEFSIKEAVRAEEAEKPSPANEAPVSETSQKEAEEWEALCRDYERANADLQKALDNARQSEQLAKNLADSRFVAVADLTSQLSTKDSRLNELAAQVTYKEKQIKELQERLAEFDHSSEAGYKAGFKAGFEIAKKASEKGLADEFALMVGMIDG